MDLLSPDELSTRFPWIKSVDIECASLGLRNEGWFDPWSLLMTLKDKAKSLGVQYHYGKVTGMTCNEKQITSVSYQDSMRKEQMRLTSDVVINAAGAWSKSVMEMANITSFPVEARKRSVFSIHCPAFEENHEFHKACPLVVDPSGVYFRPEGPPGMFICGVSPPEDQDKESLHDDDLDFPDHYLFDEIIWPALAHRVKAFESIKVKHSWAGYYAYNTLDQNALIGKHPEKDNLFMATGFSGHGLQQAPGVGRGMAELLLDGGYQTIDLSAFSYDRVIKNRPIFEQNIV